MDGDSKFTRHYEYELHTHALTTSGTVLIGAVPNLSLPFFGPQHFQVPMSMTRISCHGFPIIGEAVLSSCME